MSYKLKTYSMNGLKFKTEIIPKLFDTLTKARAYAIKMMDEDYRIHHVQVSNPKYMDEWQVYTGVDRADDGKYYWSAIRSDDTIGAGNYVNKNGSVSKRKYMYDGKGW